MKRISSFSLFLLAGVALLLATGCQKKYQISADTDAEMNNKLAYIYSIADMEKAVDSVQIVDQKFTWDITDLTEGDLYLVQFPEASNLPFVAEKAALTLNMEDGVVRGGAMNDELADFLTEQKRLMESDSIDDKALFDQSKAFFEKNKELPMSLFALDMLRRTIESPMDLEPFLTMAGERVRAIPMVAEMIKDLESLKKTLPGNMFVDFDGVDDQEKPVKLSDYVGQGQYVLLDFWASWCPPCRKEIPFIKAVYEKYRNKGLVVVGIAVGDTMEDHLKAVENLGVVWPQINDVNKVATNLYGITGIPQIMLIGPDGVIIKRDLREAAIEEAITPLFS